MLTFSVSALAQEKNDVLDSYVEVSIDDLNRGISIAFYNDELFVIPSGVNKVRIGYTSVRLSTVADNYNAGSKSKAVST